MNKPFDIKELITRYIEGEVSPEERRLVEDHMKQLQRYFIQDRILIQDRHDRF